MDYELESFRATIRRDKATRERDDRLVREQRMRPVVSLDFLMGNADARDEPAVAEVAS